MLWTERPSGSTSAYCKTVIKPGKRIFEKYDKILYGPTPESLIRELHSTIRNLLKSQEALMFSAGDVANGPMSDQVQVGFIDKFVEPVLERSENVEEQDFGW